MPAKKLMFNAKQIWDISENTQRDCRGGIAENEKQEIIQKAVFVFTTYPITRVMVPTLIISSDSFPTWCYIATGI
mgnify:CR=1 FL=1